MPDVIIVAGPNGAGKTSFAKQYLLNEAVELAYVNADEIAGEIASRSVSGGKLDILAGRIMIQRVDELVSVQADFMLETTLASLSYAQKIQAWQRAGYHVGLFYLRLPNVETAIERVRRRVAAGGHAVPEGTIRTRFTKSAHYLENIYKPIVDEWYVWNSIEGDFEISEAWNGR